MKSVVTGLDDEAVAFNMGVSFKKTSLRYAFLYAVEFLSVMPSLEADALPSISPSEIKSKNVTNCLLCKVSGVLVG